MSGLSPGGPLVLDAPDTVRRVREHLDRVGYTEDGVHQTLRAEHVAGSRNWESSLRQLPQFLYRTRGDEPLHSLLRLFFLGVPVPAEAARRAVAPMALEEWTALGLLAADGDALAGTVDLFPVEDLVLVSDSPWCPEPPADQVLSLSQSAQRLANAIVRRSGRRALELGTGCGYLAFLAARHHEYVVATDCSARALNLAAFGAQLNGITNIEFRAGDLFAPVEGETFDLVVMNPPFVISPGEGLVWRDSGTRGDLFCRRVVQAVPPFLNEGGWVHLLANWAHRTGEDADAELAAWFAGTGCDAWVLRGDTLDAATYVSGFLDVRPGEDLGRRVRRFEDWIGYFERERIEAVTYGLITLRRQTRRPNWYARDLVPLPDEPCGDAVAAAFARRDWLASLPDDDALLGARVRPAPALRWEQQLAPSADGWTAAAVRVRLAGGLALAASLDPPTSLLLQRCQGVRALRDVLGELVQAQGWDAAQVRPAFLRVVRSLLERGFLVPAEDGVGG
jgi:methylase of polypeptide subunit release factors